MTINGYGMPNAALLGRLPQVAESFEEQVANAMQTGQVASPFPSTSGVAPTGHVDFGDRVGELLRGVSGLQQRAETAADGLVRGEHQDVHGTMIAMQEADVAFRLTSSIRSRVIEAYREVMRMSG